MIDHLSEQQERELSDRFSGGVDLGSDTAERRAFRAYHFIRSQLRSYALPELDEFALSDRLASEMGLRHGRLTRLCRLFDAIPAPAFAAACTVCVFLVLVMLVALLERPHPQPVTSVEFLAQSTGATVDIPRLWEHRLQRGRLVTVPAGVTAKLRLSDGSTLSCSSETQIAIHMSRQREIALKSGSIKVKAAQIPGSIMTVKTPLGTVTVLGTVFRVSVIR